MLSLRDYQDAAVSAVLGEADNEIASTLVVLPTGTGKTVVFSEIANRRREHGRIMVIAHRSELIEQAANKLSSITGIMPSIEKADQRSDEWNAYGKPPIVVASVQTLSASRGARLKRFDPHEFSLLVIDEAHHACAETYQSVIQHFRQNKNCLVLGVTATPDRGDGDNLGLIFQSCAFEYTLVDAIDHGYLVPIRQRTVEIAGLDFTKVRTTAGDLNQGDLEAAMMLEEPLHGIAHATLEVITGLKPGTLSALKDDLFRATRFHELREGRPPLRTVVFATSVMHAERLAEILNRWIPGCADYIDGGMTSDLRKRKLQAFAANDFQILVNVMIATEGFDAPFVECVVVARPTKSRPLFAQIVGRGTRPSDMVAHKLGACSSPEDRRALILNSDKPHCLILDFAGNNGRHELVTMVDLIASENVPADVLDRAKQLAKENEIGVADALSQAAEEIELKRRQAEERRKEREAQRDRERQAAAEERKNLVGVSEYDIFDHGSFGLGSRVRKNDKVRQRVEVLHKNKVPLEIIAKATDEQLAQLSREVIRRRKLKLCTFNQAAFLRRSGYTKAELQNLSFDAASKFIGDIKAGQYRETMP